MSFWRRLSSPRIPSSFSQWECFSPRIDYLQTWVQGQKEVEGGQQHWVPYFVSKGLGAGWREEPGANYFARSQNCENMPHVTQRGHSQFCTPLILSLTTGTQVSAGSSRELVVKILPPTQSSQKCPFLPQHSTLGASCSFPRDTPAVHQGQAKAISVGNPQPHLSPHCMSGHLFPGP